MKKALIIFILLSGFASFVNYITYPILARILPETQYVNLTVALSLLTQISTFLSSIVAITIGLTKKSRDTTLNNRNIEILQSTVFKLFALLTLVFLIASPLLLQKIQVPLLFVVPICLLMLVSIPIAVVSGFLNGHKKMGKLGILTFLAATLQFTAAFTTAVLTHDGIWAMIAMSVAQIATIILVYYLFRSDNLPHITKTLWQPLEVENKKDMRQLVGYMLVSSIGIMIINIAQIADLLIIKTLTTDQIKFYTDIYVISRVVFFGGMIFIWPFLGEINTRNNQQNYRPLLKVMGYFVGISLTVIAGLFIFGSRVTSTLFGVYYSPELILQFGTLSILYKLSFLVLTAVVLYFIVLHNYKAVFLSAIAALGVFCYSLIAPPSTAPLAVLYDLNIIAGSAAIVSLVLFVKHKIAKN